MIRPARAPPRRRVRGPSDRRTGSPRASHGYRATCPAPRRRGPRAGDEIEMIARRPRARKPGDPARRGGGRGLGERTGRMIAPAHLVSSCRPGRRGRRLGKRKDRKRSGRGNASCTRRSVLRGCFCVRVSFLLIKSCYLILCVLTTYSTNSADHHAAVFFSYYPRIISIFFN